MASEAPQIAPPLTLCRSSTRGAIRAPSSLQRTNSWFFRVQQVTEAIGTEVGTEIAS